MKRIREIHLLLQKPIYIDKELIGVFMAHIGGDIKYPGKFHLFSYSWILIIVDSVFPLLWILLIILDIFA